MKARRLLLTGMLLTWFGGEAAIGESITGRWRAIDDKTGEPKSIVEMYDEGGRVYGKIVELFTKAGEDPDPICDICPGKRKNQKILGMVVVEGLEKDGDTWVNGEILDPENGKIYRCKVWLENGKLRLRGYVSVFFRTQTWLPAGSGGR